MKKSFLFLIATFLFSIINYAQMGMGKPKDIQELGKRDMIIIVEQPNTKVLARLKKKNKTTEIEEMKKMYEEFNTTVKEVMEKNWTMNKKLKYLTWDEFKKMPSTQRIKYGIMYFMTKRASSISAGNVNAGYTILRAWMDDEKEVDKHNYEDLFQSFTIDKAEDVPVDKLKFSAVPVYTITLPEMYPTAVSVFYAIKSTTQYFSKRMSGEKQSLKSLDDEIKENSMRVKDKTLLIRKDWISKELPEQKIKELYKYSYEIVDDKKLDEIVKSGDEKYAFFIVCPYVMSTSRSNSVTYFQYIVDNKDGEYLAMYRPSMGKLILGGSFGVNSGQWQLNEKSLQGLVDSMK